MYVFDSFVFEFQFDPSKYSIWEYTPTWATTAYFYKNRSTHSKTM